MSPRAGAPSAAIQNLRASVIILDLNGRIIHFNRAAEILSGYRLEEALGRRPWDFLLEGEDAQLVKEAFENLRSSGLQTELECEWIQRDGHRRVVQWSNAPVLDETGKMRWIVDSTVDLTEERRALREISAARDELESDRRIAQFLSETTYRLSLVDLNVAKRLELLCRLTVPYLADWCFAIIQGGDTEGDIKSAYHWDPARTAAIKGFMAWTEQFEIGKVLLGTPPPPCHVTEGSPFQAASDRERKLLDELGCAAWSLIPIESIHSRSRAALFLAVGPKRRAGFEANCRAGMELARRVGPHFDNSLLYERAQKATRLRDDFLALASHELRTPITPLLMQVGLIQRHLKSGSFKGYAKTPELQKILKTSADQLASLAGLIENMMSVSRIRLDQFVPRPEEMDLSEIVQGVVDRFSDPIARAGCRLKLDLARDVRGLWDPSRIEQVVTNLITNAIKFGSGAPIEISVSSSPEKAILKVRDHGVGVNAEERPRIFERFERSASRTHFPGLGLGLYISRQIVQAHHGSIRVESGPEAGATFVVELPFPAGRKRELETRTG